MYGGDTLDELYRVVNKSRETLSYMHTIAELLRPMQSAPFVPIQDVCPLDKTIPIDHIALSSFPRSGCTLVRHIISMATGIATGSCYPPNKAGDM